MNLRPPAVLSPTRPIAPVLLLAAAAGFLVLGTVAAAQGAEMPRVGDSAVVEAPPTECWRLDRLGGFCPHPVAVVGAPLIVTEPHPAAVSFDGKRDGLEVAGNPIAGWPAFTIEMLIRVDRDGPAEQRFLHIDVPDVTRALIELRLDPDGTWCLDTYLRSRDHGLTLIDRERRHPAGTWAWVALRYDGRTMSHFVDGVQDASGEVEFAAMPSEAAVTTLGMRANRVSWYRGSIAEVRFSPTALDTEALQRRDSQGGVR